MKKLTALTISLIVCINAYCQEAPYLITKDGEKIEFSSIQRTLKGIKADSVVYKGKELNEIVFGSVGKSKRKHIVRCNIKCGFFKCKSATLGEGRFYLVIAKEGETMILKKSSYVPGYWGYNSALAPMYYGMNYVNRMSTGSSSVYYLIKDGEIESKVVAPFFGVSNFSNFVQENFTDCDALVKEKAKHKKSYYHKRALKKAYLGGCL